LLACSGASYLPAGSLHILPIRVEFTDRKPSTTLQISNEGDDPVTVQIHTLNWKALGAEDVYSDASDILVNPPIAHIAGHETQLIRLALRHPAHVAVERSWRLIIEEVPPPPKAMEVRMVLKISIPIFLTAHGSVFSPRLTWEAAHLPDGSLKVTASNNGNAHIQFRTISLLAGGAGAPIQSSLMAYILPGGTHEWVLSDERLKSATHITLEAETDSGKLHEEINPHSSQ
jgi:fimbrial chaperone protein